MLISRKGKYFHVLGCISKNFPENIFWCLEKKENTNPEKHKPQPRKKSSTMSNQNPAKCIKSGKRNQNPAKENESMTSGAIATRRSMSDAIAQRDLVDRAARRSTSDAIVRTIAPRDLIDRARRLRRSSARCDRPTSGAIDDRRSSIWALSSLTLSLIWALSSLSLFPKMN